MKTFEQVYDAWMAENIAEAKQYVKALNKLYHKSNVRTASSVETRCTKTVKHNFSGNLEDKLKIRLTA